MKIGIFTSYAFETPKVVEACKAIGVDYEIVDILSADWVKLVQKSDCDGFFCSSCAIAQDMKNILDERYYFVSQIMKRPIYPDFTGLFIHESKRNMAAWLETFGFPHAKTKTFTRKKDALEYLDKCEYPVVVKQNLGSGAKKVRIVKSKYKAKRLARRCFPPFDERWAPLHFGLMYWTEMKHIPAPDFHNIQKDYFLVQEYVKNVKWEWRILKVGDSYFGHQKLIKGKYASGSGLVGWVDPPKELLLMVKDLCEKGGFPCMDVDVLEDGEGKYFINELQAFFGSYADYQMSIDGKHGRYVWRNGDFHFEEGDFNVFGSNKLKIEHFIEILKAKPQ